MSTSVTTNVSAPVDTIDVADVVRALRRGWRSVLIFTVLGVAAGLGVVLLASPKFTASSSVVMKVGSDPSSSLLSRLTGGMGEVAVGAIQAMCAAKPMSAAGAWRYTPKLLRPLIVPKQGAVGPADERRQWKDVDHRPRV